jgi:uncharacterized protein YcbK (DUF882 family)
MDNEDSSITSRRKFLKQIACGSLLAMGGSGVASAAVRNVIYPAKRGQSHTQPVNHNIKGSHAAVNHGHAQTAVSHGHAQVVVNHGHGHAQVVVNHGHGHAQVVVNHGHGHAQVVVNHGHGHAQVAVNHGQAQTHGHNYGRIHSRPIDPEIISRHASLSSGNYYTPSHKTLSLEHEHTGDKLKLTYFEHGRYVHGALEEINYLMRDYHTDDVHPIDTALLDQLFDLNEILGITKPMSIVSGYRSPFTNAQLRKNTPGVAEHSLHMQGRAIDIRIEGMSASTIKDAALSMAQGGVGFYPYNNFVHLDTGDIRTW